MSSNQQIPPLVQEQLAKLQQTQQNLQSILAQKQQLNDDDMVFKHAGTILIKSNKKDLIEELDEKKELAKTKASLLAKQEERLKITLKEGETKIQEMIKNQSVAGTQQPQNDETRK